MASVDPFVIGIVAVILGLIFFGYLLLRRTVLAFEEGRRERGG